VADEVEALRGQFVVEVGVRQAWPFLTFCDNERTPARETRLYIDSSFRLDSGAPSFVDGDPDPAVTALLDLNGLTVTDLAVSRHNELRLVFDDGQSTLIIDAAAREFTAQDIWWLGRAGS
jgi:hypothetical protein